MAASIDASQAMKLMSLICMRCSRTLFSTGEKRKTSLEDSSGVPEGEGATAAAEEAQEVVEYFVAGSLNQGTPTLLPPSQGQRYSPDLLLQISRICSSQESLIPLMRYHKPCRKSSRASRESVCRGMYDLIANTTCIRYTPPKALAGGLQCCARCWQALGSGN